MMSTVLEHLAYLRQFWDRRDTPEWTALAVGMCKVHLDELEALARQSEPRPERGEEDTVRHWLQVAIEDYDSANGRSNLPQHWTNRAREVLTARQPARVDVGEVEVMIAAAARVVSLASNEAVATGDGKFVWGEAVRALQTAIRRIKDQGQ